MRLQLKRPPTALKVITRHWLRLLQLTVVGLIASVTAAAMADDIGPKNQSQSASIDKKSGADTSVGKYMFVKATCWGCHPRGENSLNGDRPLKGPAFLKKYEKDETFIDFVRHGSPEHGMPKFSKEKLSDTDLKNILAYVRSLSH